MAELSVDDQRDDTHFWIYCPGCGYGGKIGVPHNYPADVVVCPKCRQVVNVRPEDRLLWQPAEAMEFLQRRFPRINWNTIDREPALEPAPVLEIAADDVIESASDQPAAGAPQAIADEPAAFDMLASPRPATLIALQLAERNHLRAAPFCASAAVMAMLFTLLTFFAARPPWNGQRRPPQIVRAHDMRDAAARNERASADPPAAPWQPPAAAPAPQAPPQSPLPPSPAALAPVSPPQLTWQELYDRAYQQMQAGEYAPAVKDLNEVLRVKPGYADALERRIEALFELGQYQQALADVNDEIRLLPTKYRPLLSRAVLYEELGDWQRALADIRLAARMASGEPKAKSDVGRSGTAVNEVATEVYYHALVFCRECEYKKAIDLFTVLMRQLPGSPVPIIWRAACYQSLGINDLAMQDFNRGLAMRSAPASGYVWRAILHEHNQDLGAAVLDMRKAVRLAPTNRDYRERLKRLEIKRKYHPQRGGLPLHGALRT
ncbi:MAG TPA: tetratricopeptide repeat protein [Pirellulales bacterium]